MPVMYNTGDWFVLSPDTYRKLDLHSPDWPLDVDLENMYLVGAPYGGPIAITVDPKQMMMAIKGSKAKQYIRIFNTVGGEYGRIAWNHGKLIAMGWSDAEQLICVQDDALVFVYDIFGKEKENFSMGEEASLMKIVDAKVFQSSTGTGVAVITTNGRVFLKQSINNDMRARLLPEMAKSIADFSCWEIVTENRNSYCLLGREKEIIKLFPGESIGSITRNLFDKPFDQIILMSASYNHQNLALYTNTGLLWLGSIDMQQKYCEFESARKDIPKQIEWIMNIDNDQADAVVIAYTGFLLIVNRNGDKNLFTYDPAIYLIAEMDGVRILTSNVHEFVQRLPHCVQNIFAINSQEPSSFLFEAQKKYQEKSHQADEYLSLFRDRMQQAVDECIEAAGHEFSIATQKSLMRAAYFGKGFIVEHNPESHVKMLQILRILNALRDRQIAIPLTIKQCHHLKISALLFRLVYRKQYALAIEIAKFLKLSQSWILEHWASHKVLDDEDDAEVAKKIIGKFKKIPKHLISFCNIAEIAYETGRKDLAIQLLPLETRVALQVPLLLKLQQHDKALQCATQSGDTDLLATTILAIKEKLMLTNFHMLIREYPLALNIYKKIMDEYNSESLYGIYNAEDDHKSIAIYRLRNALNENNLDSNLALISNSYMLARRNIESELCSDISQLRKIQNTLNAKYNGIVCNEEGVFRGLTLHSTVVKLLEFDDIKEAEKLRNNFKISDRRFHWLRLLDLSNKSKWEDLEKYSKSKKNSFGFDAFVEVCLKQNNLQEANKYILKCRDDRKCHWFMRAGLYGKAAEAAFHVYDLNSLQMIQQKMKLAGNQQLLDSVNTYINLLAAKK